jgi:hypothetical protein
MERRRRWLPLLVGGGVVAVAVYAAGSTGSTTPTTTSTTLGVTLIDEALTGPVVEWQQLAEVGAGVPIAFGRSNGDYFLFGAETRAFAATHSAFGWRSSDLVSWVPLDLSGFPEAQWFNFIVDDAGLVAAVYHLDAPTSVWTSGDGETWTEHQLPVPDEAGAAFVTGAVWHQDSLIVHGQMTQGSESVLSALPSEMSAAVEAGDLSWSLEPGRVTLHGPMSITVYRATFAELGIESASFDAPPSSIIWITADGVGWTPIEDLPAFALSMVISRSADGLVASGWTERGGVILTSADGRAWESTELLTNVDLVAEWNGVLIARSETGPGLRSSIDGSTWTTMTPTSLFPSGGEWSLRGVAAGPMGLMATAVDWGSFEETYTEPPPIVIEKSGYLIELSRDTGVVTVSNVDGPVLSVEAWQNDVSELTRYDVASGNLVFIDPADGSDLVTVTADEWRRATIADEARNQGVPPGGDALLIFTTDGETWSASSPDWLSASAFYSNGPIVVEEEMALAVSTTFLDDDTSSPQITIWQGTLP